MVSSNAGIADQPPPRPRSGVVSIQALVREDLVERERLGVKRYGTPLQPGNGRDALVDLYQELLDACCYARQAVEEERTQVTEALKVEIAQLKADLQRSKDLSAELRRQLDSAWKQLGTE